MTEPAVTTTAPPQMPEAPVAERSASDDVLTSRERGHASVQSLSSPQIAIHDANTNTTAATPPGARRPSLAAHISAPAAQQYQSPMRQHKRTPSQHREIKETLNARSEYTSDDTDGTKLRINQYVIREEIGRGSYGAVHLATDQFGNEYATKEFSKARLRRRAQSNILRRPNGPPRPGARSPWAMHKQQLSQTEIAEAKDALFLIREEIAVMKKLNHPNLVQLIEVLDDPEEDSLWMVLEMCQKGVVMKVGLDDHADPYPEEKCRHWFRDLILGVEYLHAQGVIHRDIKPDNLLLTTDDVLKIVDFGVSEMFEKPESMMTAKSAGSPAFLPPELCIAKHGDVDGKAADIWSMGVTLYCLKYGRLPFKRDNVLDMYEAIREDVPEIPEDENPDFADLVRRLLDKNADTRICMADIREHAWVTKGGVDALLSEEENCADEVEMPNELEVNHAFTPKMSHMLAVMIAISKFKSLVTRSRTSTPPRTPRTLQIPVRTEGSPDEVIATPPRLRDTKELAGPAGPAGRPRHKSTADEAAELVEARKAYRAANQQAPAGGPPGDKGHAHEVTDHEPRLLGIGLGARDEFTRAEPPADIVSDSPTGIDFDIYDRAFEAEVERIRSSEKRGTRRTTYLTRFVNEKEKYFGDDCMILEAGRSLPGLASTGMNKASAATIKALEHLHLGADADGTGAGEPAGKREQLAAQFEKRYLESQENVQAAKDKAFRFADVVTASMQGVVGAKGTSNS